MKPGSILLDSSALKQEPGSARVVAALNTTRSTITTANLEEVLGVLATREGN